MALQPENHILLSYYENVKSYAVKFYWLDNWSECEGGEGKFCVNTQCKTDVLLGHSVCIWYCLLIVLSIVHILINFFTKLVLTFKYRIIYFANTGTSWNKSEIQVFTL